MTMAGDASLGERPEMLGVFLRAAALTHLTRVPAANLTDRVIALEDLWGPAAYTLAAKLFETAGEAARLGILEAALLQSMGPSRVPATGVKLGGLTAFVLQRQGRLRARDLAEAAGVSRQHLTRIFQEMVGVSPNVYCRLARFHATLRRGGDAGWARIAAEMGYADQSHMIAEFRRFSSLTPDMVARGDWFHPFIERV
jgi:AraC-like DNA-binding protein